MKKVFITTAITAIVIAIATVTTTFSNVAVLATPFVEQVGNDTNTTGVTTSTGGQQSTIHIIKDTTNSYVLSGGSSSVGSFDTTYRVAGERSAIRSAENLIITTITDDFSSSPTIGYVMAGNTTTASAGATLPNPFATPEQITERITNELRRVISEAENNTVEGQDVEIKCGFGMTLQDMQCHYIPLLQAGQG
ncbi:MAG TPA: hypothetical protein VKA87_02495 [Nitrososphaeraceae archaeon]|nr:hypothetical protein [Nitrososphaeraceae archaeon]